MKLEDFIADALVARNPISEQYFSRHASAIAAISSAMAERFVAGGRLLAFGRGCHATDAQHISVEFIHPVIVGKKALPALDLSSDMQPWLASTLEPHDIVVGFTPVEGDDEVSAALRSAQERGALTLALPGEGSKGSEAANFSVPPACPHPFIHQEMIEVLYHTLWETVHVFLEHHELGKEGKEVGAAGFLYPYLGQEKQPTDIARSEVAASIETKAKDDCDLRRRVAEGQADRIAALVIAARESLDGGGRLIVFGNGGSATDANDFARDCVQPPDPSLAKVAALSLAMEPANISAIANDVGAENIFRRQLIAHARPGDVAVGISTSGGSSNIVAALEEARRRGLVTVALLGGEGGEVARRQLADHCIVVPTDYVPRVQEVQASIYHVVREALGQELDV